MTKETFYLTMADGNKLAVHRWIPQDTIAAVLQISHGMAEYALRYDEFAAFLTKSGFAVYAHDHRGHGSSAPDQKDLGFIAHKNGFQLAIDDLHQVIEHSKTQHPQKKLFLLGHSFGSFLAQGFIEQYGNEIDGCILSGSAGPRLPLVTVAKILAGTVQFFMGTKHHSVFIKNLAFGSYNKGIENPISSNAWLSRNDEVVKAYDNDPYCGFNPTVSFFYQMFSGLCAIHQKEVMEQIPKDLPLYIFAGSKDPVGDYGKSLSQLHDIYNKIGIKNVELKFYEGGRHEMLNETNKQEVMQDCLNWLKKSC